jgi:uncharacterized membrane protein YidH (DUF202 family)
VPLLRTLYPHRRRPEPALDIGLPAERTAMAWQRTALALAGFSALLVHLAERKVLVAVPGLVGLALALALLVVGERRYGWTVRRVEAGETCMSPTLVRLLTVGVVALSAASLALVVVIAT